MPACRFLPILAALLAFAASDASAKFHVFAYHDVRERLDGDFAPDQYAISTANLIDHFTWLRVNDFEVVTVDQLLAAQRGESQLPERAVLLTFDDGFRSVYTHVFPLLKLFGYPAVISLVTDWLQNDANVVQGTRLLTRDDFLTEEQIREMADSGLIEFASHSHSLHQGIRGNPQGNEQPAAVTLAYADGTYESEAEYLARVGADLVASSARIEALTGKRPRVMTWPFGAYNEPTLELAGAAGMGITLTLDDRANELDGLGRVARHLVEANPGVESLAQVLLNPPGSPIVRAAQVDLDYVYDADEAQQEANLGRLLDRIKALQISHVFLQAFADPDADGGAQSLYFPNSRLPMRADLFNRAAWQLRTRANVQVYAWLPLLSFEGEGIDPAWRLLQNIDGRRIPDRNSEPRLSPFEPEAVAAIHAIYRDLARHADFDGLLFHDDGRMNEFEDASDAALRFYQVEFGPDFSFPPGAGPARNAWAQSRSDALIGLSQQLAATVRTYRPRVRTVRNLFASALLGPDARLHLAQDYAAFLEAYDYVALMAMPYLEGATRPRSFYRDLVRAVAAFEHGKERTIFELQTVDWRNGERLAAAELARTFRDLQARGIRHLAYYPDDFIEGHPALPELRSGISIARYPAEALQ